MSQDLIGCVARALLAARYGPVADVIWREKWARINDTDPYLPRQARAAIGALRGPTDAIIAAMHETACGDEHVSTMPSEAGAEAMWRAGVAAALGESPNE